MDSGLAVGESTTVTVNHVVTQGDIDAGVIGTATLGQPGTATATSDGVNGSGPATASDVGGVNLLRSPAIGVVKSLASNADEDASGDVSLNDTLTYSFLVTNSGNVTLSNVSVSDPLPGLSPVIPANVAILAPASSTTFTATYTVSQGDVDAGVINNTSTASGAAPDGSDPSDTDTESVPVVEAVLTLSKVSAVTKVVSTFENVVSIASDNLDAASTSVTDSVTVATIITYTITVENIGTGTAVGVVLTDTLPGGVTLLSSGGGTVTGGSIEWDLGNMGPGTSVTKTVSIQTQSS